MLESISMVQGLRQSRRQKMPAKVDFRVLAGQGRINHLGAP